jgi:glycosyltransferase involved in cell wall biosynthesis
MRHLLFFGELPGGSVHGISIANCVNLEMLGSCFIVDRIEEKSILADHDKITLSKIANFIKNNLTIVSKSFSQQYDYFYLVFSLSSFGSFKSLMAILSFRIFNKGKVVLHLHRGDFFVRFYKTIINRIITKLVFRFSHKIVVLSDNQKIEFEAVFHRSFYVLPNTIEIEYKPEAWVRNRFNFIFISNYLIDKGIIDLLEVFKKLIKQYSEITLETYGDFADKGLKDAILDFNSSNIGINGPVTGIQKFEKISQSDCLVLPSWNEGQPIVLLEAMSVGTPVIASGVGLIPELLGKDYQFLINPMDRESLEIKILQFLKTENINEISHKLSSRYYELYSQKKHFEILNNIFN